jgi:hypothetical protein
MTRQRRERNVNVKTRKKRRGKKGLEQSADGFPSTLTSTKYIPVRACFILVEQVLSHD